MKPKVSAVKIKGSVSKSTLSPVDETVESQVEEDNNSAATNHNKILKVVCPINDQINHRIKNNIVRRNLDMEFLQTPSTSQTDSEDINLDFIGNSNNFMSKNSGTSTMIDDMKLKTNKSPGKAKKRYGDFDRI